MIAKRDYELIKAIKNHKCCGKSDGSSDNEQGGGNTPSGDIGYEEIYQFYVKQIKTALPPGHEAIFPDTFNDIISVKNNVYPDNTLGIWKANSNDMNDFTPNKVLFVTMSENGPEDFIIFAQSNNPDVSPI